MSHNEEHHDSDNSGLRFHPKRMLIPGIIIMFLMFTYSSWAHCSCQQECCEKDKCKKECSKEEKEHHSKGGHDEKHEGHDEKQH